jgi:Cdc6-like AAA superfamily ATPase
MASSVAEWFGLKRPNFILDPKDDCEFYAHRTGVDIPKIIEGLQVNLVTDRPPKRIFWGIYGGGKTHTLFNIAKQLEKLTNIHPVYVECPSVPKKSTFLQLYHDGIMASMGQDFVIQLFKDLIADIRMVQYEELLQKLKEIIEDEELSRASSSLLGARAERILTFWRFISGVSVPARDLADIGQTQALADADPSKLAEVILVIGRLLKRLRSKTLVLIIDEFDRLKDVSDEFGLSTY